MVSEALRQRLMPFVDLEFSNQGQVSLDERLYVEHYEAYHEVCVGFAAEGAWRPGLFFFVLQDPGKLLPGSLYGSDKPRPFTLNAWPLLRFAKFVLAPSVILRIIREHERDRK